MGLSITFQPTGIQIDAPRDATILEAAREGGIALQEVLDSPCGGQGLCGSCRVKIVEGETSVPSRVEQELLSAQDLANNHRLACQTVPLTSLVVETHPLHLSDRLHIQLTGLDEDVELDPPVRLMDISVTESPVGEPAAQWGRLCEVIEQQYNLSELTVDTDLRRDISDVFAYSSALVTVRDHEIINLRRETPRPGPLGLAVDLGTTKIAGYLVDLASGDVVAAEGLANPQLPFGSDVVSRLAEAVKNIRSHRKLREVVVEALQELVRILTDRIGAVSRDVEEVVVAGNTAMHHLFLNLPVAQLARSPFVPAVSEPILCKARELGMRLAPGAYLYMIPPIDGFVGGDHVAMILASRLDQAKSPTLGLDIGTNTEIALAREGRLACCSCASGPAFEGRHLSSGMPAAKGAVASLRLGPQGTVARYDTIGGGLPLGICGSGSLDILSEMVRLNIIDENGLLDPFHVLVRKADSGAEFLLFSAWEAGGGRDIVMTQRDISEIQLAKAAIASGIELLMATEEVNPEELSEVLVAGAFGSWLNPMSAVSIGMLPDIPVERIRQIGNAAGAGAIRALVSLSERRKAEKLAHHARRLDLATHPDFGGTFARALRFTFRGDRRDG
jgi:uncharacterized 2Fe-2S/4Fe-4S cluster protein (DUF4445 family)